MNSAEYDPMDLKSQKMQDYLKFIKDSMGIDWKYCDPDIEITCKIGRKNATVEYSRDSKEYSSYLVEALSDGTHWDFFDRSDNKELLILKASQFLTTEVGLDA